MISKKRKDRFHSLDQEIEVLNKEIMSHKTSMLAIQLEDEKKAAQDKEKALEKDRNKLEKERSNAKR